MAFNFASGEVHSHEAHLPQLIRALTEIDAANTYVLLLRRDNVRSFPPPSDRVRHIVFPRFCRNKLVQIFCEQVIVPLLVLLLRIDLLHFPTNVRPLFVPCRTVGTIHWVLTPLLLRAFSLPKRLYSSFFERMSLRKADRLIAVSSDCKTALVASGVSSEKIDVIPHGISEAFRAEPDPQLLARFGIRPGYLLFVGSSAPYKNLALTISAYEEARRKHGVDGQLVIVGNVANIAESDDVIVTGYVPYETLPRLYASARAFVSLSLQETFGIVLLEAMASGVPMVISSIPAYVEVANDAALIVDPHDAAAAAEAIGRVWRDEALRTQLIGRGLERVKQFAWNQSAAATLKVLKCAA
jgi:glycosyltransferase involved in cell wall biosynthesis